MVTNTLQKESPNRLAYQLFYTIAALWLVLAVLFGMFDLKISQTLVNREAGWGNWGAAYGELPGILLMLVAVYVAHSVRPIAATPVKEVTLSILTILISSFFFYLLLGWLAYHVNPELAKQYGRYILLGPLAFFIIERSLRKTPVSYPCNIGHWGVATLLQGLVCVLLFVQGFKSFWGRVRFVHLRPDFSDFTPWYLPGPGGPLAQSFPSGHSALAWMVLPLFLLFVGCRLPVRVAAATVLAGWGIFVSASRVAIGAHYASDVLFASCVSILCFLLFYIRTECGTGQNQK